MTDIILDTLKDGLKLLPFLFFAFLIIELFEHKLSQKSKQIIGKSGKLGPFFGAVLGAFPQCGFSVMATNLYVTRIISLGTLISVYLSTSDEMIPVLISQNYPAGEIFKILAFKVVLGMFYGFLIDFILRKRKTEKESYDLCENDHCDCERHLFKSAFIHTLKTLGFIMLVSFVLNIIFEFLGVDFLNNTFGSNKFISPFLSSLMGLIPNCGASIVITELYINNVLSLGSTVGGLLTGSGVGLLVLFKQNKNKKENILVLVTLYFLGAISGLVINLLSFLF